MEGLCSVLLTTQPYVENSQLEEYEMNTKQ